MSGALPSDAGPPPSAAGSIDSAALPQSLAPLIALPHWVVWKWETNSQGRRTKVPYRSVSPLVKAATNNRASWSDYPTAAAAAQSGEADGIGFCLLGSGIAAFDIDRCRDPVTGAIAPWAQKLVNRAASYTEITISGTGLRIIGLGDGKKVHRKQNVDGVISLETYRLAERYIVVTGNVLPDAWPKIQNIDELIDEVVEELERRKTGTEPPQPEAKGTSHDDINEESLPQELLRLVRDGTEVGKRSAQFHHAVGWLKDLGWRVEAIYALLARYPGGIAAKYAQRLRPEIERSFARAGGTSSEWETPPTSCLRLHWHGEAAPEPRRWLVEEVAPETGKGLLAGQWGAGKTFVALDLAASVMTGVPFAGRPIIRKGGVLFVAAEGSSEIPIRLRAIAEHKLGRADSMPFAWVEECPPIAKDQRSAVEVLVATAMEAGGAMTEKHGVELALIVIDTVAASAAFKDENDAAEAQTVMNALETLSRRTNALVLGVDHFGKMADTGTRGSSAKEAAADVVLALLAERATNGTVKNTRMAVRKLRGGRVGDEISFVLKVVSLSGGALKVDTSCVVEWQGGGVAELSPKRERWPKSLRIFRSAMETALIDHGKPGRPFPDGPEVKWVGETEVRREFYAAYPAASEEGGQAKRKAYGRALKAARDEELVVSREIGGVDYLWLAKNE